MALEPFVPRKDWSGDADESIGDFITRRLGSEITDRLAAPLLGGIFAGDASELSLRATFPMLMNAEKDHGSLVLSMRAARKAQAGKPSAGSAFFSLRSGLDALVAGLSRRLGEEKIHTGREVTRVAHTTLEERQAGCGRYRVEHGTGASETADHVVLAAPAHVSSTILRELSPSVSEALGRMQYVSTATCFLAMKREDVDHPLDASGFLVPRTLGRPILAATWVSSKWPDRAPPGHVLMRVFYGGAKGQEVLSQTDDELAKLAFDELARFLKLSGKPLFSRVYRFHKSNPQPKVGHLIQMASLREKLSAAPGLHVVGSGFDGVGISDCIKQGRAVAKVIAAIQSSPQTAP